MKNDNNEFRLDEREYPGIIEKDALKMNLRRIIGLV